MMLRNEPHVLVVLVNYKRPCDTIACLSSVSQSTGVRLTVAVADNSPEHSGAKIEDAGRSIFGGNFHILKIFNNIGFAGGNNACIKLARDLRLDVDFFWILNNDTTVLSNCLEEMLKKFSRLDGKIGICGSTLVYHHNQKTVQAYGGSIYRPLTGTMQEVGNGNTWPAHVDEAEIESKLSYICGASMLVSAQFMKDVGLMEEDYFLFYEEIDWCTRAKKLGYKLGYASKAVVYHKEGASIGTGVGAKRSLLAEYYGMRNKLKVTRRFFPWALPTVWLIGWAQVARRAMQGRLDNAKIMAQVLCGLGRAPR